MYILQKYKSCVKEAVCISESEVRGIFESFHSTIFLTVTPKQTFLVNTKGNELPVVCGTSVGEEKHKQVLAGKSKKK